MCEGRGHAHGPLAARAAVRSGLKIAVSGKGGVGKTTLCALLARAFASEGRRVLAIDADPDANLASALGVPEHALAELRPIAGMRDLALERTGAADTFGALFKLNPQVSDLPEACWVEHLGVRLLTMGSVRGANSGCVCPEHALVRSLVRHLLLERDDVVIMDMEAGIEHLGRGTAESVDALLVVVEPGQRSFRTAAQIQSLGEELGIPNLLLVGSKVRDPAERDLIAAELPGWTLLGCLPWSESFRQSDADGGSVFDASPSVQSLAFGMKEALETELARRKVVAIRGPARAGRAERC